MNTVDEKTRDMIANLLYEHPELRDNDNELVATVWSYELDLKNKSLSAVHLLRELANGHLTSDEAIKQTSRDLKEIYPNLRSTKPNKL